ncbi:hypothetical protein EB796_007141 [Bugula neritina]|uniref:Uncharacterized protein n=1 Tax=Bugula neritina TaxID=10212 RepID=A0A7J7K7E5_BUGNE|nr:hypothetical protein EB796_007141 [Bugula neritina]
MYYALILCAGSIVNHGLYLLVVLLQDYENFFTFHSTPIHQYYVYVFSPSYFHYISLSLTLCLFFSLTPSLSSILLLYCSFILFLYFYADTTKCIGRYRITFCPI